MLVRGVRPWRTVLLQYFGFLVPSRFFADNLTQRKPLTLGSSCRLSQRGGCGTVARKHRLYRRHRRRLSAVRTRCSLTWLSGVRSLNHSQAAYSQRTLSGHSCGVDGW